MDPFVKASVLLVLYLKRRRKKRERKKEAEGMFCVACQVFLKQLEVASQLNQHYIYWWKAVIIVTPAVFSKEEPHQTWQDVE